MAARCYKNIPKDDAGRGSGKDVNKKNSGDTKDKGITEVQPKMKHVYRPKATDVSLSNVFKTLENDLFHYDKRVNYDVDGVVGGPSIATGYCDLKRGQERDSAHEWEQERFQDQERGQERVQDQDNVRECLQHHVIEVGGGLFDNQNEYVDGGSDNDL